MVAGPGDRNTFAAGRAVFPGPGQRGYAVHLYLVLEIQRQKRGG